MADSPEPTPTLSPPLARLLGEPPDRWTPRRLWSRMPLPCREEAVRAVLEEGEDPVRIELLAALARAAGFRAQTFEAMRPGEVARHARTLPARKLPFPDAVLRIFLVRARGKLLSVYLDAAGVPHQNGRVEDGWKEPLEAEIARNAADGLLGAFPPDDVVIYLITLSRLNDYLAPGIPEWLRERFAPPHGEPEEPDAERTPEEVDEAGTPEPELIREARGETREQAPVPDSPFSPLDRALIQAAVDSAQGVTGAPDALTLEDMVAELLDLNGTRHRSFFHRGFVDALQGTAWRSELPAENRDRRRWYAAGWLSGLARRDRHDDIVELYDEDPRVRDLGPEPDDAARLTLPLLFEALCATGREPEAVRILSPEALAQNPLLLPRLLDQGTRLLRADDPERARPFFNRLGEVVDLLEEEGEPTTEPFFLEIRRRRAHCYRQLGEADRARELLERLLAEDPSPDARAMVQADLGLLDAGLRSLSEVRLWRTDEEKADIVGGLREGQDRFQASRATASPYRSHGAWPLGVLAMAEQNWEEARDHLSLVRSSFLQRPGRYDQGKLLARVSLAAGIAEALSMDLARMARARELLVEGTKGGARIPRALLGDVLDALETAKEDLDREVLTAVLELEGPDVLDYLRDSETAGRTPAVAFHLMERAEDEDTKGSVRAHDLRTALPILLSAPAPTTDGKAAVVVLRDQAGRALDLLEELAHQGVGQEEFLELLSDPDQVDPAWSREDAAWSRIHLLENRGDYEDAVSELRKVLGWVLSGAGRFAHEDPEGIVARAKAYGLSDDWTRDLEDRLAGWMAEHGDEPDPDLPTFDHPDQQLRILVVGGDERQNGFAARVQAKLDEDGLPIRVKHIPTGWGGNWAGTLDEALREAERHDGLVLLRFMRTGFGRSLRKGIECPWVSCPGVGVGQVVRRVRKVAGLVGGSS